MTLGTLLQKLRDQRGLSQSDLARRAEVSPSTVSRWESGKSSPNIPELEAALRALAASPEQTREALRLLQTPRAERRIQQTIRTAGTAAAAAPAGGDLLRAMRLRRAMTQEQLAHLLQIPQNRIVRWERSQGDVWPSPQHLQELCFYLQATPEEFCALTQGRFTLAEVMNECDPDALHLQQWKLRLEPDYAPEAPLKDLRFLALEARLHLLLSTSRSVGTRDRFQRILSWTYSRHAEFLQNAGRIGEAATPAGLAIELQKPLGSTRNDEGWVPALMALAANQAQKSSSHRKGLDLLQRSLDEVVSPTYKAWALVRMARFALQAGLKDEAVDLSGRALRRVQAENGEDLTAERRLRARDHAAFLLAAGRAEEAAHFLPRDTWEQWKFAHEQNVRDLLLRTSVMFALRQEQEAGTALRRCYSLIERLEREQRLSPATLPAPSTPLASPLRSQADQLAQQLA